MVLYILSIVSITDTFVESETVNNVGGVDVFTETTLFASNFSNRFYV